MKEINITKDVQKLEQWDRHQTIYVEISEGVRLKIEWPMGHKFEDEDLTISRGDGWERVENKNE